MLLRFRRRPALVAAIVALALVAAGALAGVERYSAVKRQAAAKKEDLRKFKGLEAAYTGKKAGMEEALRKTFAAGDQPAIAAIERAGEAVGVKIASVRQTEEKETLGYAETRVEVRLERVELNQIVNLLFHLDRARTLIVTREFSMRTRFEDPDLYDLELKLSHIKKRD